MSKALDCHKEWKGKIEVIARSKVDSVEALSLAYTPGVAEPCLEIQKDNDLSYVYTRRHNMVAVITDGSAVLGLGDIGPLAGMPVMEGKAVLFKEFADVDAFPICVSTKDVDQFCDTVANIAGSFGGINLEDISAPRCFAIERKLKERLDIPVFHDDQHGTAVVVLAALTNAIKIVNKKINELKVVILGAGAAGGAIARLLLASGVQDVLMCDRKGIIYSGREGMDEEKAKLADITNKKMVKGGLSDAIIDADVFLGVSGPNTFDPSLIEKMAKDPIIFAMSNPVPEINPLLAKENGAVIVGTGRSDYPNQINNVLAFPGIFRGALDVRASQITENMKIAAAMSIASLVSDEELNCEYIIPKAFDQRVGKAVAKAVSLAAIQDNVNRI